MRWFWVVVLMWVVPFAACVAVMLWYMFTHGKSSWGKAAASVFVAYWVMELAGYLYRRARRRRG